MSKELLSEINKATQDTSEAGKDIGVIEAKLLIEKIEKSSYKSQELDIFLSKIKEAYNKIDKEKQDYKDFVLLKTGNDLENIKKELETKTEEEDKKADIKAEKTWKTNILKGVGFESIENEKIRTNLLEYLKIHAFGDDVIKMLEGIRDNYSEIYNDENFCEKLLKINPYISQYMENPEIINNLINKKEKGFFVLTENKEKLKGIMEYASKNGTFKNLIDKTDVFIKNIDPEIQEYILNLAVKNEKTAEDISKNMHKFNVNIPETLKEKTFNKIESEISEYFAKNGISYKNKISNNIKISLGNLTENESIINDLIQKNDTNSIEHIKQISIIINRNGGYIDDRIKTNYLKPIKINFLKRLKAKDESDKLILNEGSSNIIKSLDPKEQVDCEIAQFIQNNLIDKIIEGNFGKITNTKTGEIEKAKNIEFLGISLEKGFPINENKIKQLFENQNKIIMKLSLRREDEDEIQKFHSLVGDIKEFLVKSKLGENVEIKKALETSKQNIKDFEEIQKNSEKIKENITSFYKKGNNKDLFKKDVTLELLQTKDFTDIDNIIGLIEKGKLDINNFKEITDLIDNIINLKTEENIEQNNKLKKGLDKYLSKKLGDPNVYNEINKEVCKNGQCSLEKKEEILKSLFGENEYKQLKETDNEKDKERLDKSEKYLNNLEEKAILENKKKKNNRVKESPELQKIYIDYANGIIDEKAFQEQKTEINKEIDKKETEAKKDGIENQAQTGPTMTKDGPNYFITDGYKEIKLSDTEAEEIKNNPKKIEAVLKFKNEMDDLGLGFLWNYRKILFQNVKNYFEKEDAINIYDGNISDFEITNLLNFVGEELGFNKSDKYENIKKQFEENKNKTYFELNGKKYNTINPGNIFEEILTGKKEGEKGKLIINGIWQEQNTKKQ